MIGEFVKMVQILLPYGKNEIPVEIAEENLLGIYYPKQVVDQTDEQHIMQFAIQNPIGSAPLREIVHRGQKVAIVTSDLTRPTPTERMLPFIAAELEAAGIPDEDVFLVLALGLHRPMDPEEMQKAVSRPFIQRYRIINHDPSEVLRIGVTRRGTPVDIFRPLVEADVRICLGNIEFHYFAGFSGGAKAILPGCASRETVTANHSWMVYPQASAMRIEGNPVREDLEEGAAMVGVDFIFNVIVDGSHRIVGAYAGDVIAAHRRGCQAVIERGTVDIPYQGDIIIASAGGYPKDINLYQAHKGLENAKYFVREGGEIILVAECIEGFGNKMMESWMREIPSADAVLEKIKKGFVLGGHKAAAIALIEKHASISLVSSLDDTTVRQIRWFPFPTVQTALNEALIRIGEDAKVIVLPQAGSILPKVKDDKVKSEIAIR